MTDSSSREIDAIGEQRHRADGKGNDELNPELAEVQQGDAAEDATQADIIHGHFHVSDACIGRDRPGFL